VGKTTTSVNLGASLAELGYRVLVVDLDPQASLTRVLLRDFDELGAGIGACLGETARPVSSLIRSTPVGIDLVPGDRMIEIVAFASHDNPGASKRLRRSLAEVAGYDVILLDTPPQLGFALTSALLAADWAIMPTGLVQQDFDALLDTLRAIELLEDDGEQCSERLAIVPNQFQRNKIVDKSGLQLLTNEFGELIAEPVPFSEAVKKALNARQPVTSFEPRSSAATAYRALAKRVTATLGLAPQSVERKELANVGA
jgi:chromosome partitioning protein